MIVTFFSCSSSGKSDIVSVSEVLKSFCIPHSKSNLESETTEKITEDVDIEMQVDSVTMLESESRIDLQVIDGKVNVIKCDICPATFKENTLIVFMLKVNGLGILN